MAPTSKKSGGGAKTASAPYSRSGSEGTEEGGDTAKRAAQDGRRHLSCENCRIRKAKCSRQDPCLSCRMRGDDCKWLGAAPNGTADEDELEQSAAEVVRLKRLVDLLLARLEEQDGEGQSSTAASRSKNGHDESRQASAEAEGPRPSNASAPPSATGAGEAAPAHPPPARGGAILLEDGSPESGGLALPAESSSGAPASAYDLPPNGDIPVDPVLLRYPAPGAGPPRPFHYPPPYPPSRGSYGGYPYDPRYDDYYGGEGGPAAGPSPGSYGAYGRMSGGGGGGYGYRCDHGQGPPREYWDV